MLHTPPVQSACVTCRLGGDVRNIHAFRVCFRDGVGCRGTALALCNGSILSFGSFHAMHETAGQGSAGVDIGHGNSWTVP
jgi:hypothetical protein